MRYKIIELKNEHPAHQFLVKQFTDSLASFSSSPPRAMLERAIYGLKRKRPLLGFIEKFGPDVLENLRNFNEKLLEFGLMPLQRHCFLAWVNELDSLMATQVFPLFFKMQGPVKFCFSNPLLSFGGWKLDERGHLIGVTRQIFHWMRRESEPSEILCCSMQDATRGWFLTKVDKWTAEFCSQLYPLLSFECVVDMTPDGNLTIRSQYLVSEALTFFSEPVTPIEALPAETRLYTVSSSDTLVFCSLLEQQFFRQAFIDYEGLCRLQVVLQAFRQEKITLTELIQKLTQTVPDSALSAHDQLKVDTRLLRERLEQTRAALDAEVSLQIAVVNPPMAPIPPGLLQQFSAAVQWFSEQVVSLLEDAQSVDWRP